MLWQVRVASEAGEAEPLPEQNATSRYTQCAATNLNLQIVPDLHDQTVQRELLSWYYGGSPHAPFSTISEGRRLSKGHGYEMFFFPVPEWSPDIPRTPGARGLCLTVRVDEFTAEFPLFICLDPTRCRYLGDYEAIEAEPLTKEEWLRLPMEVCSERV